MDTFYAILSVVGAFVLTLVVLAILGLIVVKAFVPVTKPETKNTDHKDDHKDAKEDKKESHDHHEEKSHTSVSLWGFNPTRVFMWLIGGIVLAVALIYLPTLYRYVSSVVNGERPAIALSDLGPYLLASLVALAIIGMIWFGKHLFKIAGTALVVLGLVWVISHWSTISANVRGINTARTTIGDFEVHPSSATEVPSRLGSCVAPVGAGSELVERVPTDEMFNGMPVNYYNASKKMVVTFMWLPLGSTECK